MNLKQTALNTRDIEYPGRTIEEAREEAERDAFERAATVASLKTQMVKLEWAIAQEEVAYCEADRAFNLFSNALLEHPEIDEEAL